MFLGALILALLGPGPVGVTPKPTVDPRAECLKSCAGAPKDATGKQLMDCLGRCDAPDAGR